MVHRAILTSCLAWLVLSSWSLAQDRATKVRNDRKTVEGDGYWIYNDLDKGFAEAAKAAKPLLVVIRCIPCEACAKLDQQVVDRDPAVRKLLDDFVCVRIVQREKAGLDAGTTAFRVRHVGEYGEHAVAKKAGFQKGDVLLSVDGASDYHSEAEIMARLVNAKQPGVRVEFAVLRDGKRMTLGFAVQ